MLCLRHTPNPPNPQAELAELSHAKKAMLESSVFALQEGEALLERLHVLGASPLDSRPQFIRESVGRAIEQVNIRM